MEVKNIITILSSAGGFFLLLESPYRTLMASILLLYSFLGVFILRLAHFLLMQYNRLTKSLHAGLNWGSFVLSIFTIFGLMYSKFLAVGTFLSFLPFDYYVLVALMSSITFVVSIGIVLTKFSDDINIGDKKIVS